MPCDIKWLNNFKPGLKNFIDLLSADNYSYFKYSLSGDIFKRADSWGLGNLVFAAKILYMANLLQDTDTEKKQNLINAVLKFSTEDGYISDPLITKKSLKKTLLKALIHSPDIETQKTRRAETRQSFAALYILGSKPYNPFLHIPCSLQAIDDYLNSFDWSKPWDAGSHFSHLLFFLNMNNKFFGCMENEKAELIQYAVNRVLKIQSKDDGCWYTGNNVSLKEKINGAMKIITGFHAAGIYDFPFADKLINTALSGINDSEACSNFNIVLVLYACKMIFPDHRGDEINSFLENRLELYEKFYFPQYGGFSFHQGKANDIYYGKKISKGKNEPDIHGTCLFLWGITLINNMMNLNLNLKAPND